MKRSSLRYLSKLLLLATCVLVLATGCWHRSETPSRPRSVQTFTPAVFVGSAACAACHPAEYKSQNHSRHAQTLSAMSRELPGKLAPPTGPITGTEFRLLHADDRFLVAASSQPQLAVPLDFAFGSGKTGITYVFVVDDAKLVEMRSSYFPHYKKWYVTPGQERLNKEYVGGNFPTEAARACFLCHAVTLPDNTVTPQRQFFGVGCESCHGPGSAHIVAQQAGNSGEGRMEALASRPAARLNELCGKCHGTEQEVQQQHLSPEHITRLQTVGLMRSRCFKQSRDTLSCITCHDPHTDVGTTARSYEAVCLQCHSASMSAQRPLALRAATIKSCPVNPKDRCLGCHMPKRQAIANAKVPTLMADHFIRVYGRHTSRQ